MNRLSLTVLAFVALSACTKTETGTNKFSDATLLKISNLQDRRMSDSLILYLSSESSLYRKEAALAFASVQDSTVADRIGKLLTADPDKDVKKAAALALGQTRSSKNITILSEALTKETDPEILNEILEAYGKVTAHWTALVASEKKSEVDQGLGWSLYRAGLNGKVDSSVNSIAAGLLDKNHSDITRLGAAHFFARGAKDFESAFSQLSKSALTDNSIDVQMAAAFALRKIKTDSSFLALEKILLSNGNYRIRVNAIRALQAFPLEKSKNYSFKALDDPYVNVGITASEVIMATVSKDAWIELANRVTETKNWRIQANLYQAILKVNENKSIIQEIKDIYLQSKNPYQKAALLAALQQSLSNVDFIEQELLKADTAVLRSSAAAALVELNRNKNFNSSLNKKFATIYMKAMSSNDPAVIGTIAGALADSTLGYRNVIKDFSFLYEARKKLSLPKDNEALQPLEEAIAHFEKRKSAKEVKNEFNHPINWNLVKTIPADQRAIIKTSKGTITLRLLVEEAPGSVANFVELAQKDYFDKKVFHRVVPNFVVQAGCNRGDGWGSEDYSIRSEFSQRRYTTGSVGMASAGKDTEGTQWFITHSPTPHLDGKYTIFAEVISGMEVVHMIEVGDQILDVEIKINTLKK